MGIKKTIVAGLIFAAVTLLYFMDQRRIADEQERRTMAVRLIPGGADRIESIVIMRSGSPLELRKDGERWRILRPIVSEADPETVAGLLYFLETQENVTIDQADEARLADFGLTMPALTATIRFQDSGEELLLRVGENSALYGEVYARLGEQREYFTISATLRNQLSLPLYAYRDKALLPAEAVEATALSITVEGRATEMRMQDSGWSFTRPIVGPADDAAVEAILRELIMTRAIDFIDTSTLDLARYGLDSPSIVAVVSSEQADQSRRSTLLIGRRRVGDEHVYYALRLGRDVVFTVPQALVSALRTPLRDLRSKQIFTLDPEEIVRLSFRFSPLTPVIHAVELVRDPAGQWHFEDDENADVDQRYAEAVVRRFLLMKVSEYLSVQPALSQTRLDTPMIRAVLSDESGQRSEGIEMGRLAAQGGFVYARRVGGSETFGVPLSESRLFWLKREDFLDKTLFEFDREAVDRIEISEGDRTLRFQRDGEMWIGQARESFQVKPINVELLLLTLLNMPWDDALYPANSIDLEQIRAHGLENPGRRVVLYDRDGRILASLGQGGQDRTLVYIRRGADEYFGVKIDDFKPFLDRLNNLFSPL